MVKYIVYIVDESVRGDFLGINGHEKATTPYLKTVGKNIFNFGISSSIANCSEATRLALRSGLRRDQIPDFDYQALKQPTIWQYAKKGGFEEKRVRRSGMHRIPTLCYVGILFGRPKPGRWVRFDRSN
ncbi:MAG: hypothetical protein DSY90_09945 [Deltaproteobacteria bacterium]|nr:MAG: hypothetical protein DSY90_09945 [Deltaproteobacteria bacterium]